MDIYDIGKIYFMSSLKDATSSNRTIDRYFSKSYILGFLNFILKFFHSLIFFRKSFKPVPQEYNHILVYGPTINNRHALTPITDCFEEGVATLLYSGRDLPMWKMYLFAMPHLFDFVKEVVKATPERRPYLKMFFPKFWRMYGCPKFANKMLDFYNPKILLLANDHQEFNRCLIKIANNRNIKTCYVQHASAGHNCMPLQFSYAFLDGQDTLIKFKEAGSMKGNVILTGGVRFDSIKNNSQRIKNNQDFVIGLAINLVDDVNTVKQVCMDLLSLKKDSKITKLFFRPHPMIDTSVWKQWCFENGILFSDPRVESSFYYLNRVDVLIANQSSIHLDAAMCHVPSIVYNLSASPVTDIYSYVKNGLVPFASSEQMLFNLVLYYKFSDNYEQIVQFYNASYKTEFEGNIANLISSIILSCNDPQTLKNALEDKLNIAERNDDYTVYVLKNKN